MATRENLGALIGLLMSRDLAEVGGDETSTVTSRVSPDDPRGSSRVYPESSAPLVRGSLFLSRGGKGKQDLDLAGLRQ